MPKILRFAKLAKQINNPNLLVNGNFDIWQRGTSFTETSYSADRWFFSAYTLNDVDKDNRNGCSAKKVLSGGSIDNNSYAIELENYASGYYYSLSQPIITQNVLPHQGETATFSYYARSPDGSFGNNLSGSMFYSTEKDDIITNKQQISDSSLSHSVTSGTWTKHSHTFSIPASAQTMLFEIIPEDGDTLGANSKLQITQAKLEIGSQASPLIPESVFDQLEECESYYQIVNFSTPLPNSARNFSQTIPLRNRLRLSKDKTRIRDVSDRSRNIDSRSLDIQDPYCILCNGSSSRNDSNLDLHNIVVDSDLILASSPAAPTNVVSQDNIVTSGLVVSWSGSANNGSYINYYMINYGTTPDAFDRSVFVDVSGNHPSGTPTSGTISGLLENQQYYFNITSVNGFGSSNSRTYSHYFDAYPNPSAVYNLTGVYNGHTSAVLNWQNLVGSPTPDKYIFQRDTTSSFNSSKLTSITVDNPNRNTRTKYLSSYVFDGDIANYTSAPAYYRVIATLGPESGVSSALYLPRSTAPAPSNIMSTALVNGITLNWIAPNTSNGARISDYAVQYSTDSGNIANGTIVKTTSQGSTNNIRIDSLAADTEVFVRIASVNPVGTGSWSDITSETPNRTPGTTSVPRNLTAEWTDYQTFIDGDWTKSRFDSDRVVSESYTPPGSSESYPWPVSLARVSWNTPADNGGQNISYYNIQLDTSPSYDSSNYQSYNTTFWRQNSLLLINKMITSSASTWYYKCAGVTPSGTGLYASGTLNTAAPKALLIDSGSTNNAYEQFNFVLHDSDVSLHQNYYVNSCGLPLLSGYALTGLANVTPTLQSPSVTFPRNTANGLNSFDLTISGLPQNSVFRYQPIWHNAAGTGTLNRPAGSIAWESGTTPVILSEAFSNLSFNIDSSSIQGKFTNSITVPIVQNNTWTTSMGTAYYSGIYYSGIPSDGGTAIATGIANLDDRTFPVASLPYSPTIAWLRVHKVIDVQGTTYTSAASDFQLWSGVAPPTKPTLQSFNQIGNTGLVFTKTAYTASLLNDDLSNGTGKIYHLSNYELAVDVDITTNQSIINPANLLPDGYAQGTYQFIYKVCNSGPTCAHSSRAQIFVRKSTTKKMVFHRGTILFKYPTTPIGYIWAGSPTVDYWRYNSGYYTDRLTNHFSMANTDSSAFTSLKSLVSSSSMIGYIYPFIGLYNQVQISHSINLTDGVRSQSVFHPAYHTRGSYWYQTAGDIQETELLVDPASSYAQFMLDGVNKSIRVDPVYLPDYNFTSPTLGPVQVYLYQTQYGSRTYKLGYGLVYDA